MNPARVGHGPASPKGTRHALFADRADAGRKLAIRLMHLRGRNTVVLGLPRGGVPVAFGVARALGAPLDVIVVRKLRVPFQPELAMGVVGEDGTRIINEGVVAMAGLSEQAVLEVEREERVSLDRQADRMRAGKEPVPLDQRTALIVDEGVATGATARAACRVARTRGATRVVVATPVAPQGWEESLDDVADELVCVHTPPSFLTIGQYYTDFRPTSEGEVEAMLRTASERPGQL